MGLSDRTRTVWAKSHVDELGGLDGWLPLYQHLDDAASVAAHLWDEWAPRSIKRTLARSFGTEAAARSTVVWLAGVHDVGKASPAFAVQVPTLAGPMHRAGLEIRPQIAGDKQRQLIRHEVVSHLAIRTWLRDTHGLTALQANALASIAAAHHGNPPSASHIHAAEDLPDFIGTGSWEEARVELLDHAARSWTDAETHAAWRDAALTQPALVLLDGLVIVADWIASSNYFPCADLGEHLHDSGTARALRAWRRLRFPAPWTAQPSESDAAELLARRFTLPPEATPHATQLAAVDIAREMAEPELMIIEAEMGSGKTEAALLAAEILAAKFGLSGIFIGLPTRATADGMFGRIIEWARRLELGDPTGIYLAHGTSALNPDFERLTSASFQSIGAQPTGDEDAIDEPVIAHRWFSSPRRGPLASFVVGTVDQALFAGHRSRYVMLRHLAFASKVVIIDEAHAYDDFMTTYLERFLEWVGAYEVPVIMLSATLPSHRRGAFHAAYARGRAALRNPGSRGPARETHHDSAANARHYPLISATRSSGAPALVSPEAPRSRRHVSVQTAPDDNETLLALIDDALRDGGTVAIIRNTVRRAQETAALLRTRTRFPVTVAHSHFLAIDRARKDRDLVERFGPRGDRPAAHIVVATQVIEQSLDLDFDLLISDIAPIDLLLQRVGRLHRHHRAERPAPIAAPRLVITGMDAGATPPTFDGGAKSVYGELLLLRSLAALDGRSAIALPDDIAPLVEAVYGDEVELIPEAWRQRHEEAKLAYERAAREQKRKASSYTLGPVRAANPTLIGWITGTDVDPELAAPGRATVRDSEGETLEVIVLQRGADGILRTPSWIGGLAAAQIPDNEVPDAALTRAIMGCKLRLPIGMCGGNAIDKHIAALERAFDLPFWHGSHLLKGELVLVVDAAGRARLNEFDLDYSAAEGLRFTRRERVNP